MSQHNIIDKLEFISVGFNRRKNKNKKPCFYRIISNLPNIYYNGKIYKP